MNLCAKLTLHIHTNKLPNSVTAKLGTGLPSQHLGWKSTQPCLTDSYGPELSTSRDPPARAAQKTIPSGKEARGQGSW